MPAAGKKKKRILWLSDSPTAQTGFGVVAKNVIDNICAQMEDIEIMLVAINLFNDKAVLYNDKVMLFDGRFSLDGGEDPYCRLAFLDILENDKQGYDGIVIINDFGVVAPIIDRIKAIKEKKAIKNKKSFGSFLYVPVDGYVHPDLLAGIDFFDVIATYNEYSKKQILSSNPLLYKKIKIIPHGCNQKDLFHIPKQEVRDFRKEFFGAENADKIIFTNVNRNQLRKDIMSTIFCFMEAKKNWIYPDRPPFLYLHMGRSDVMGHDLVRVMPQTGLVEGVDYKIAPEEFWTDKWGTDIATLNKIYNASDIFITTTLGEGWGLSVTEAMSVRLPVICPLNTSLIEITDAGRRAYILTNTYPVCNATDSNIRTQVDMYEGGEVMIEAARNMFDGTDQEMLDRAQYYARSLKWNEIAKQFVRIFKSIF